MTGRSIVSKYITDQHRRASRALGYALILGNFDGWKAARLVWIARLSATERAALAYSGLTALDSLQIGAVIDAVRGSAGMPQPALLSEMDQARFWADLASPQELKAYCFACYQRLQRKDQDAFLDLILGRVAA